jgi:hypothetical protein
MSSELSDVLIQLWNCKHRRPHTTTISPSICILFVRTIRCLTVLSCANHVLSYQCLRDVDVAHIYPVIVLAGQGRDPYISGFDVLLRNFDSETYRNSPLSHQFVRTGTGVATRRSVSARGTSSIDLNERLGLWQHLPRGFDHSFAVLCLPAVVSSLDYGNGINPNAGSLNDYAAVTVSSSGVLITSPLPIPYRMSFLPSQRKCCRQART